MTTLICDICNRCYEVPTDTLPGTPAEKFLCFDCFYKEYPKPEMKLLKGIWVFYGANFED